MIVYLVGYLDNMALIAVRAMDRRNCAHMYKDIVVGCASKSQVPRMQLVGSARNASASANKNANEYLRGKEDIRK